MSEEYTLVTLFHHKYKTDIRYSWSRTESRGHDGKVCGVQLLRLPCAGNRSSPQVLPRVTCYMQPSTCVAGAGKVEGDTSEEMNMSRSLGEARVINEARNKLVRGRCVCETGVTPLRRMCAMRYDRTEGVKRTATANMCEREGRINRHNACEML